MRSMILMFIFFIVGALMFGCISTGSSGGGGLNYTSNSYSSNYPHYQRMAKHDGVPHGNTGTPGNYGYHGNTRSHDNHNDRHDGRRSEYNHNPGKPEIGHQHIGGNSRPPANNTGRPGNNGNHYGRTNNNGNHGGNTGRPGNTNKQNPTQTKKEG